MHRGALLGRVPQLILLGSHLSEHDRVGDLEMRGVGGQRQMDVVAVEGAVGRGAEMILDVAGPLDVVGRVKEPPLNSWKIARTGFDSTLREHVEAAAMRHPDDDLAHAERAAALDDLLERRDHRLASRRARSAWCPYT